MKYYVEERKFEDYNKKTAGVKARDDAEAIFKENGYQPIKVWPDLGDRKNGSLLKKIKLHYMMGELWKTSFQGLQRDDVLFLQLPVVNNYFFLGRELAKLRRKGVRIVGLVHDLEIIRMNFEKKISKKQKVRMRFEEQTVLQQCWRIIVHNERMKQVLVKNRIPAEKMICLGIFDYLIPNYTDSGKQRYDSNALIVAGNLAANKAGYLYKGSNKVNFNVYGVNYEGKGDDNLCYKGSFSPEDLPSHLEGRFGLVWDGDTSTECSGAYGEYLKYNNPHKTSLYLAAGFPIMIWKDAALADFVLKEKVGFGIEKIDDAQDIMRAQSREDYAAMLKNVNALSAKLRNGYYLKKALKATEI